MIHNRTLYFTVFTAVLGFWAMVWLANTGCRESEVPSSVTAAPQTRAEYKTFAVDFLPRMTVYEGNALVSSVPDVDDFVPDGAVVDAAVIYTNAGGTVQRLESPEELAALITDKPGRVSNRSASLSGSRSTEPSRTSSGLSSGGSSSSLSSQGSASTSGGGTTTSGAGTSKTALVGVNSAETSKKLFMFAGIRNQSHFRVLEFTELRPLFAPDFVWHVTGFRSEEERLRMVRLLRYFNKNIIIGYYHSACTTLPPEEDYEQPSKMPNEHVQNDWILKHADGKPVTWPDTKNRFFLDLRKDQVRQAMIALAISRAKHYGYDALSFDNCYWGYGVPASTGEVVSAEDWTKAFMKFYDEASKAAHENGLKCVVNVATPSVWQAFEAISPYVDGIMTEMPFHENVVKAGNVDRELAAYEKAAKEGTMVLLMQTYEGRGQLTLDLARPLVDKYDNIYISITDFGRHYFYHGREKWHMSKAPPVSTWYRNP